MILGKHRFNSRRIKGGCFFLLLISTILFGTLKVSAHPSPNSLVLLDINPDIVRMEVQLPVPELELAFGNKLSQDPEHILEKWQKQLDEYLLLHIKAKGSSGKPWKVKIENLRMDKGFYADNVNVYWEVVATIILTPIQGESTRDFFLEYDVIMHEVMNHVTFVSVRSDWELGNIGNEHSVESATGTEALVIARDLKDNIIHPLHINLNNGSIWIGFVAMIELGMHHISEGTDHLMFLLVLLLTAPLICISKKWQSNPNIRQAFIKILKITLAFTIGHSLTLILATLGVLSFQAKIVEIIIALSILITAIHAIKPIFPNRENIVAIVFGLIHGLAFSSILSNLHLEKSRLALSLLGFNIGIELMQLIVILMVIPWLLLISRYKIYNAYKNILAGLAIIASFAWMAERISEKQNIISEYLGVFTQHSIWFVVVLFVSFITFFILKFKKV